MAKPAIEARLAAAAKGYTQVIGRGNAHILARKPGTSKCCYIGQVGGGWHYGAGLETDTALEPDTDANYWKMVKAHSTDYHAKRIEPQSWHDGTETYRIVYF